ncbi:MAG: hypothetical protein BM556_05015 [Bacteriovorax sp. MedPE-SWde]|nr:MAG: hypothetical protein BM556_05015 [Bacteriovorax sp. MedPE-SWde]
MKNLITLLCLIGVIGTISSCASESKKAVNYDRSQMSPMISKNEMVARISHSLDMIPNLTKEQKSAVQDIHADVMTKSWEINHKIRQHKILLFKYLGDKKYDDKKINYVKSQVEKLYKKKISIMISSFGKLKKILGKNASEILKHHNFMRPDRIEVKEF